MLNSAASALVDTEPVRTIKKELIGQNLASRYGNMEGKTESVKEQLESLNVYINRDNTPENDRIKMASQSTTEEEKDIRVSQLEENFTERKRVSPGTERNKRVLPATPKTLYSTPSQSAGMSRQSSDKELSVTSNSKRLSSSSSLSIASSNSSSLSSEPEEDSLLKTRPKQTHIALYKFVARHDDEVSLDIGDAIHVDKKCEDLWYEGINLRTSKAGIFPSRYASDILQDSSVPGEQTSFFKFVNFFLLIEVEINPIKMMNCN